MQAENYFKNRIYQFSTTKKDNLSTLSIASVDKKSWYIRNFIVSNVEDLIKLKSLDSIFYKSSLNEITILEFLRNTKHNFVACSFDNTTLKLVFNEVQNDLTFLYSIAEELSTILPFDNFDIKNEEKEEVNKFLIEELLKGIVKINLNSLELKNNDYIRYDIRFQKEIDLIAILNDLSFVLKKELITKEFIYEKDNLKISLITINPFLSYSLKIFAEEKEVNSLLSNIFSKLS